MRFFNLGYFDFEVMSLQRVFLLFLTIIVTIIVTNGQTNDSMSQTVGKEYIDTKGGRLLTQGNNNLPAGYLKVLTYKLEELRPAKSIILKGKEVSLTEFRLTITVAEKLTGGTYFIWIDDTSYNAFLIGQNKLGIVLNAPYLPNGARLAVSPFINPTEDEESKLSILPERLFVPSSYSNYSYENDNNYTLKRISKFVKSLNRRTPGVEIQVPSESDYYIGANLWFLQINDREYVARANGRLLSVWFSDEQFGQLTNGASMKVRYGTGSQANGRIIGRLDKNLLPK